MPIIVCENTERKARRAVCCPLLHHLTIHYCEPNVTSILDRQRESSSVFRLTQCKSCVYRINIFITYPIHRTMPRRWRPPESMPYWLAGWLAHLLAHLLACLLTRSLADGTAWRGTRANRSCAAKNKDRVTRNRDKTNRTAKPMG